jgi:hypothetical protein
VLLLPGLPHPPLPASIGGDDNRERTPTIDASDRRRTGDDVKGYVVIVAARAEQRRKCPVALNDFRDVTGVNGIEDIKPDVVVKYRDAVYARKLTGKGVRVAVLWKETLDALAKVERRGPYIFVNYAGAQLANEGANKRFRDLRDAAKVPHVTSSMLRDGAYTAAVEANVTSNLPTLGPSPERPAGQLRQARAADSRAGVRSHSNRLLRPGQRNVGGARRTTL